ncbi:RNA-binding protein [Pseudozyma hubeiensis SY62]|uniref:RNA-binding protein n=1 Tax=Pseudozyma hubeiensis (strain SY62) TaxID=1305764 RepID=R9P2G7_PSEHS|nr:RNA-binding protein [Pseudozyma hubeiensis SY62]GAC95516.1 RNA-binding protein [Pseudozyma hubeiensis SY62]
MARAKRVYASIAPCFVRALREKPAISVGTKEILIWQASQKKVGNPARRQRGRCESESVGKNQDKEVIQVIEKADANAVLKVSDRGEGEGDRDEVRCEKVGKKVQGRQTPEKRRGVAKDDSKRNGGRNNECGRAKDRRPSLRVGLNADVGLHSVLPGGAS